VAVFASVPRQTGTAIVDRIKAGLAVATTVGRVARPIWLIAVDLITQVFRTGRVVEVPIQALAAVRIRVKALVAGACAIRRVARPVTVTVRAVAHVFVADRVVFVPIGTRTTVIDGVETLVAVAGARCGHAVAVVVAVHELGDAFVLDGTGVAVPTLFAHANAVQALDMRPYALVAGIVGVVIAHWATHHRDDA